MSSGTCSKNFKVLKSYKNLPTKNLHPIVVTGYVCFLVGYQVPAEDFF